MHEPRALVNPVRAYGEELPRWLHGDSPYVDILAHAHAETLEDILEDVDDIPATLHALRALAIPSDYSTAGEDYVTHAPLPGLMASRDADALARSNYAVALEELEAADSSGEDVLPSRTRHWAVGYVDAIAVRPFARGQDGAWTITDAWCEALELLEALAGYPVLSDDHFSALELEELESYVCDEIGDELSSPWTRYVLEGILQRTSCVEDVSWSELEELASLAYADHAGDVLERYRAWRALRLVGDGQLTIYGEVVRVPAPPALEELEALLEDELPRGIARVVEDGEEYAHVADALEELRALAVA